MKGFKQFIEEDHGRDAKSLGGDGGHGNQYGRWGQEPVHMGVHRIEDPNVLQRLNAHIGLVNTREYIDPRSALEQVQNALMRLGYHFEYNLDQMPNEENVYPLNRFGGRKGFLDMDAVVKEDDGIENTTGESMVLRVEFLQDPDSARYEVTAQIVPASLFDEEEVQPDAIRPNRAGVPATTGDSIGIDIGEQRLETDPKKLAILQGKARAKGMEFRQRNAATQARNDQRARDSAREFAQKSESTVYVSEAVSISDGKAKGSGTFEVTFDFRGGPTKKQAQKFALAAQKRLAGASFTPNRKGNSETVVVTVKASSPRDAQVKARNVLDGVKESVDHITEAQKDGSIRRIFTFTDKKIAQRFIRSIDLRAKSTALDHAHTKTPEVIARFKNLADANEATKIAKKLGSTRTEEFVAEAQKFKVAFPTMSNRNAAMKDVKRLPSGLRTTASAFFKGAGPENGAIFTVGDDGLQTRDLMKLIKKNKGIVESTESVVVVEAAMLSRTFAFATADARDRIEKLFGLATGDRTTTTSDKGKGKFKFTVTGMLRGAQIDRIMKSVKQLKGVLGENVDQDIDEARRKTDPKKLNILRGREMLGTDPSSIKVRKSLASLRVKIDRIKSDKAKSRTNEDINESLSRTFAFPSADARNRLEKLLGLASRELVTTTDKGKGKFKFTVTAILQASQISKVMNSVKQLKGIVEENSPADMANDAVCAAIQERAESLQERDSVRDNQLKVARSTLKMNPVFQKVMGGPSKEKAIKILRSKGTKSDKKLAESAFIDAGLRNAREAVKGGKQFVSVSGKMSGKKASQTIRGAAKFLKQHGTPADKKLAAKVLGEGKVDKAQSSPKATLAKLTKQLTPKQQVAMKLMREGVQIFPAEDKFPGPLGRKGEFRVEAGFTGDDWKGPLAPAFRKEIKKAGWRSTEIRSDKTIRVSLKAKDAKQAQKLVSDAVVKARKSVGVSEEAKPFSPGQRGTGPKRGTSAEKTKRSKQHRERLLQKFVDKRDANESVMAERQESFGEDCGLSHDENAKELRRTKKDNKLASGLDEAPQFFTVVAIKGKKVVGQIHSIGKQEIKTAVEVLKKDHPGAKVSVENKSGKVVSVESVEEQLSKRKKKTTSAY